MTKFLASACAFAMMTAMATAQTSPSPNRGQPAAPPASSTQNSNQPLTTGAIPQNSSQFVQMAAASDQFEIQSSQMALQKAQNADVKSFAQQMITDHQRMSAEMKDAAQKAGVQMPANVTMNDMQQRNLSALQSASTAQFDRTYIMQQVEAHRMALQLMQGYAQSGDNATLKMAAQKAVPHIQEHLNKAQQLMQRTQS